MQIQEDSIVLNGSLDFASVGKLFEQFDQPAGIANIDLSAVKSVDSAGLAFVVWLHQKLSHRDRKVSVIGMHHNAQRLLQVSGLSNLLEDDISTQFGK